MKAWRWSRVRWALTIWTALILVWIIVDVTRILSKSCGDEELFEEAFEGRIDCAKIAINGKSSTAIEHAVERLVIGLVGAAVIGVVWLVTRDRARVCPQCGENVAKGLTACPTCGYDFTQTRSIAPVAAAAAAAPAGWYDDAQRPGHKRWWDGTAWGMTDDEHPASSPPAVEPEPMPEPVAAAAPSEPELPPPIEVAAPPAPEPVSEPAPARFCENCGAPRRPGGNFCTSCGHA